MKTGRSVRSRLPGTDEGWAPSMAELTECSEVEVDSISLTGHPGIPTELPPGMRLATGSRLTQAVLDTQARVLRPLHMHHCGVCLSLGSAMKNVINHRLFNMQLPA